MKPAVERRRGEMDAAASSAPPLDAAATAYDATLPRAPVLVPEDAPAMAAVCHRWLEPRTSIAGRVQGLQVLFCYSHV